MSWLSRKDSSSHLGNEICFYSNLANSYLDKKNLKVQDINSDFKDGVKFVCLVEILLNVQIPHDSNAFNCVKNAIQFLKDQKIPTSGIDAHQFINNKDNAVLRMLKNLFDSCLIKTVNYKSGTKPGEKSLLQWIHDNTSDFPNLQIKDFKAYSFANACAFCALISHFSPQLLNFDQCKEDNFGHNLQLLHSSLNALGIPSLIYEDIFRAKHASHLYALQAALIFHFYTKSPIPIGQPHHEASCKFTKKDPTPQPDSPQAQSPQPSTPAKSPQSSTAAQSPQHSTQSPSKQVNASKFSTQKFQQFVETEKLEELRDLKLFKSLSSKIDIDNTSFDYFTISQLIVQNEYLIKQTTDNDVIVFLGASQAGKSTSINVLRGAQYRFSDTSGIELVGKSDQFAKTGTIAGESVTLFPQAYEMDNFILLDSQGFFDTRKGHTEREIAGILLLEMALKKAKSVRAVCVIDFGDLSRGAVGMDKSGEIIERLFMDTDKELLQIFFLFNRVTILNPEKMMKFYQMTDDHKKYDYQVQIILDIIKGIKKNLTEETPADYFEMLYESACKMNIGVCDTSNKKITDILKKQLSKIPIVNEENICLYRASPNREQFQINLIYSMINGLVEATKHYLSLKYPKALIESISKEINNGLAIVEKQMEIVKNTPIEDINTEAHDAKFHRKLDELQKKICKCDSYIAALQALYAKLEQIGNSSEENINQNIIEMTKDEIKQREEKQVSIEKEIAEKSAQIEQLTSNYQIAKNNMDAYADNIEAGFREKQSVIDDMERHIIDAQNAIYDINHIIQDFEMLDPSPIYSNSKNLTYKKNQNVWEVNFSCDMPIDYENPKEEFNPDDVQKTIIKADSNNYHVIYERIKKKTNFGQKRYVALNLYTWKKYKDDNRSYLRTKIGQKESYLKEIESNISQIRTLQAELESKQKQAEIQSQAKTQDLQNIEDERQKLLADIVSLRESLEKSNEQLEMKKQSLTRLETQKTSQSEETIQAKAELNSQIQEMDATKIGLNNQMNRITEHHIKQKQKLIESIEMQRKQLEDTFASLTKFSGQLKENLIRLNQKADDLQPFYGEANYDSFQLGVLTMISDKLIINTILSRELKTRLSLLTQAKDLSNAQSISIYTCEPLNPELFINPEIEQNIWLMNNIKKEKQSLICFLQEIEHSIALFNKWQAETELFNVHA